MTLNNQIGSSNSKSRYAAPKDIAVTTTEIHQRRGWQAKLLMHGLTLAVVCALLLGFAGQLNAQLSTATMYGTVTDATDALVGGATVTLVQTDTNSTRVSITMVPFARSFFR